MINQLCCAALALAFALVCLVLIVWGLCIVARRADEDTDRIWREQ